VQNESIAIALKREEYVSALLGAIADKRLPGSSVSAAQAEFLRGHRNASLRSQANKVLPPPPNRESVIESFRSALQVAGDANRGHTIYTQRCISCHRTSATASEGNAVGPDFVTVKNAGREKLLFNILDPNREVAQQYVAYLIETKDGQDVLGILASDTPAGVTVRQAYGKETVIPRANIKRMTSQGKSLMPEGLEAEMKPSDLADLMAFIESAK
jgi:putative heme-binding domain-containing protein